jgi:hypothetical protein
MKTESTLSKIKQELISMFASLDAWFDTLLDDGYNPEEETGALEVLEHILASNASVLKVLLEQFDNVLDLVQRDFQSRPLLSFEELRFALRDQLYQSLCLVDLLEEPLYVNRMDHDKQVDLNEKLLSIAQHLRYHLELLELSEQMGKDAGNR